MSQATVEAAQSPVSSRREKGNAFLDDVLRGLAQPQKQIPAKYFYNTQGSQYFDEICKLEDYYPYRTELELLPKVAAQLDSRFKEQIAVIEFGAGSLKKIQPLLNNLTNIGTFIPIDIAADFLFAQCRALQSSYPTLEILPLTGDFFRPLSIPNVSADTKLGFFPGSTIGNFTPQQAINFLQNVGKTLGLNSHLLIGVDTKKSPAVLHRAYNDPHALTAKFNLNLLQRINDELDGTFNLNTFEHYAFYNVNRGCIEMHLVSNKKQRVTVAGRCFEFAQGESIHTEYSYKYNVDEFTALAAQAQWQSEQSWLSDGGHFSLHLLKSSPN